MGTVLHIVPDLGLNGAARQVSLLAPALGRAGGDVHVAALRAGGVFESLLKPLLPVHCLGGRGWLDPQRWLALRRLLAELQPDVLHAWRRPMLRLAAMLRPSRSGRLVVSDVASGAPMRWFDRRILRRVDSAAANSLAERDMLRRVGVAVDRIAVIPMAVGLSLPVDRPSILKELQLPPDARLIVCAGAIEAGKGFREAAWVFDILKYVYPDLWLLVLGEGPLRRQFEEFGRALGRNDFRVLFAGVRSDAAALLGMAEVVWVLGERGGRNVALEALAAGRPVVARRRPDLLELLGEGETGFLVPGADRHEVARATRRLLDDVETSRLCAESARGRAADFNVERVAAQWHKLYTQMCGGS